MNPKYYKWLSAQPNASGVTRTVSGELPLSVPLVSQNQNASDWTLKGNVLQNGTPTPTSIIDPQFVGTADENGNYSTKLTIDGRAIDDNLTDTFTDIDTVNIPSAIDGNEIKENSTLLLSEIKGKSIVVDSETKSTTFQGIKIRSNNLSSLPVGAKIKIPHSEIGDIIFQVADKNHEGYPTNSVTLITEKIMLFRCVDAKEPNNADSNRKSYGNNKYSVSNLDQWLNSSAGAGAWYSARHAADQSPTNAYVWNNNNEYDADAGFLNGFAAEFVSALKDTTLKVTLNTVTDGGSYESITRKFFLASRAEVFGTAENSIMEGSMLSLFSANTNACRIAVASAYAAAHSEYARTAGTAYYWWLRTPNSSYSCFVRGVYSNGTLNNNYAYSGYDGVRPLCNLDGNMTISANTDEDGCYTLTYESYNETNLVLFESPQELLENDILTITKNVNDNFYALAKNGITIDSTLALEEVSAIAEQGGTISIIGNTNEAYVKPDLTAIFNYNQKYTTLTIPLGTAPLRAINENYDTISKNGERTNTIGYLELTGNEQITAGSSPNLIFIYGYYCMANDNAISIICDRCQAVTGTQLLADIYTSGINQCATLYGIISFHMDGIDTASEFITYAQAQYANGTPIKVAYVKVYADTTQVTSTNLPLYQGNNTIDSNETLKPSNLLITYHKEV